MNMIGKDFIREDVELKRTAGQPDADKPRFNWGAVVDGQKLPFKERLRIATDDNSEKDFDLAEVAVTIGNALTDLLLSRREADIFSTENQSLVASMVVAVSEELTDPAAEGSTMSSNAVHDIIERALIKNNAHDIAKSFVMQKRSGTNGVEPPVRPDTIRVIRRNGDVVTWNSNKVEVAIRKAFLSLHRDSSPATLVCTGVLERIQHMGKTYIEIEELQDVVQEELMRKGHFKVAEAYILYRAHRAEMRTLEEGAQDQPKEESQEAMIIVTKEDGDTIFWDGKDLEKRIDFAVMGLELNMSKREIEEELRRSIFAEISEEDLKKTIILNAKSLMERDADFAKFAGRILLTYIYEEVIGWDIVKDGMKKLRTMHQAAFKKNLQRGMKIQRISPKLRGFDLDRLAGAIDPTADFDFDYLGIQTLYDRYLIIDKTESKHRRLETPQLFWMRVAMGLFVQEKDDPEKKIIALYRLYKSRRFCSSTPTLFNSGTLHSQMSSCYLYKVDDSIESIMHRGIAENAFLSKWAGGLGGSWTAVRGTGSYIKGTNGESQGVIPFLKLHNDQLVAVNQGGKRRGSGCAYIESWHTDIFEFLELRKNTGDERRRTHDMNTANWIPDLFMKRMETREKWTLFRSNETPDLHECYGKEFEKKYTAYEAKAKAGEIYGQEVEALDLWKSMLRMLFETGHPWITFKDPCNVRSPQDHAGVIHSSNLCTEITLNTGADETAVCNLGSIVLDSHLDEDGEIDHKKLRESIRIAVRALDNVIDINFYPTKAAKTANSRHRPIGLGVMGLQNALFRRGQSFASDEAIEFNDEFMEAIAYYAYEASSDLAKELGSYSSYEGSKWSRGLLPLDTLDMLEEERGAKIDVPRTSKMDWEKLRKKIKRQGMRNSNVLAIAPTATISNIMGSTPCIEPTYKNLFVKSNLSGEFIVLNQYLVRDLKKQGLWDDDMVEKLKYHDGELEEIAEIPDDLKKLYATAFKVDHPYLIDAAARRQKWLDQSQSLNLFLATPDLKNMSHMYRRAWHKGLKTTYYLRTLGASNIEKATVQVKKEVRGATAKKDLTAAEVKACSLNAIMNGEECESCQ